MGVRFKCKKCKHRFDIADGRAAVQAHVDACDKLSCPLRRRNLSIVPKGRTNLPMVIPQSANDPVEEEVETYEETPIYGLVSHKGMRKKHGFNR